MPGMGTNEGSSDYSMLISPPYCKCQDIVHILNPGRTADGREDNYSLFDITEQDPLREATRRHLLYPNVSVLQAL